MDSAVEGIREKYISLRRDIHQHPELGFKENRTKKVLLDELKSIGCSNIREVAETGIIVDIHGEADPAPSPKTIALRADMDGLPMDEETDLPYTSANPGSAHMCGHDGHMAMLMGALELIEKQKKQIPSNCTVRFLFQPAEEGPGGAEKMIEEGCLEHVDEVYGIHNIPSTFGIVSVKPGALMAHSSSFHIKISGKGGHASMPQDAIDPIVTGSSVVIAIQSIVSRNIAALNSVVISCCKVRSGSTGNVIPNDYEIWGTIRDFDEKDFEIVQKKMKEIVEHLSASHGAIGTIEIKSGYPCVMNHEKETQHVVDVCENLLGKGLVTSKSLPVPAGEDFSYYLQKVPGCFFFLGTIEKGDTMANRMCHSSHFDFNDNILPIGIKIWISLVEHRFSISLFSI